MFLLLLAALDLFGPQAQFWYRDLLADGGYGVLQSERAAFLIRESDGGLTLQPWDSRGFRHATYRGAIPARAIAVLHTHPKGESEPSWNDRNEARRLGLPIVVVTPEAVIAALPSGARLVIRGEKTPARVSGTSRGPSGLRTAPPR